MMIKVVIDGQTYQVDVEDIHARPVIAVIDGERFEVWPETETSASGSAPAMAAPEQVVASASATAKPQNAGGGSSLVAPLPGVIVAITVKPGDKVTKGQELCTLEAMKMKNAICSGRDGVIGSIEVAVGDQVSHGQILMTYKG
ncbi:MAG: biotin/lipoyl-binding protein [Anaerolineaceae bacterium]|nr:biotin/lipoyl-binding protein [Anaerolineaceae bacterium]